MSPQPVSTSTFAGSPARRLCTASPTSAPSHAPIRVRTPRQRVHGEVALEPFLGISNDLKASITCSGPRSPEGSHRPGIAGAVGGLTDRPTDRPLKVGDLDQREQAASWVKKPLYYTHHRKPKHEQLSQVIRLPPMQRQVQFSASEAAPWDCIASNTLQASHDHPGKYLTIVVLLYCVPCNPFHLGDVDVLKRARASLDKLTDVCVAGALVVPFGDEALKEKGMSEDRRLPFTLRRDLTQTVLRTAQQNDWVIVDTCLGTAPDQARAEGCMQQVAGSIAPFVSVYARGRLHGRQHDIRVVEVRSEDPIEGSRKGLPYDHMHVSPGKSAASPSHGVGDTDAGLASVGTLIVDVPKQSQCDHLIWSAVKQMQDKQLFLAMERFCGSVCARMIADWSNTHKKDHHRKTKLFIGQ